MITVVGGIKGGSGKTTIATNLSYYLSKNGSKLLLIDADEQASASDWVEHRENLGINTPWTTIKLSGKNIRNEVLKLKENYDHIIIDTGGRDTTSQRSALTAADIFISPLQPRSFDIWTLGSLKDLIDDILSVNLNLNTYAVINRADPTGSDNAEAKRLIEETGINLIPFWLGQRKAFANSAARGLSVLEVKDSDDKATNEFTQFAGFIFDTKKIPKNIKKSTKKNTK